MVVEVVAEELDMRDRRIRDERVREVAGEEDEGDVADVLGVVETGEVPDFERGCAGRVEHLWCALDLG